MKTIQSIQENKLNNINACKEHNFIKEVVKNKAL